MKHFITKTFYGILSISIIAAGCDTTRRASNQNKGVVIGAAIGGAAGGIIGNKMDKQAEKIKTEIPGAKVERVGEGINVTFDENNPDGTKAGVYFATGKYNITSNSQLAIDKLVKIFTEYPETNILVEGHTDNVGSNASNMTLSERRAMAVGNELKKDGLAATRLTIKWYGESQPKGDNTTMEGKASNRRVEFSITANEKMKADAKREADKL